LVRNRAKFRITGVLNWRLDKVNTFARALDLYTKIYDDGNVEVVREGRIVARSPHNITQTLPPAPAIPEIPHRMEPIRPPLNVSLAEMRHPLAPAVPETPRRTEPTRPPRNAPLPEMRHTTPVSTCRRTDISNERSHRRGTPPHTGLNTAVDVHGTGHIVVINTAGSMPSHSAPPSLSVNISVTHSPMTRRTVVISDDEEDFEPQNFRASRVRPRRPISISSEEEDSGNVEGASDPDIEPMNLYFVHNCTV
jgi:hypothetical protein